MQDTEKYPGGSFPLSRGKVAGEDLQIDLSANVAGEVIA